MDCWSPCFYGHPCHSLSDDYMRSMSWTASSSVGESLSKCTGCDLQGKRCSRLYGSYWTSWRRHTVGAVAIHGGTAFNACKLPQQHIRDLGINVQEIIPIPLRVPCLEAVGLQAVCQQHWNHAMEAEAHRNRLTGE